MQDNTDTVEFLEAPAASSLMPILCQIAGKYDDPHVQKLALSVIVSLAEAKPKAIIHMPNFLSRTIEVIVNFFLQLDVDA